MTDRRSAARETLYLAGLDLETAIRAFATDPERVPLDTLDVAYATFMSAWRKWRDSPGPREPGLFPEEGGIL